jgi:hypothetical protein
MGLLLLRVVRFVIGSALFMAGSMLMLLAAVAVLTLPFGFFMLALGLELMVSPGGRADRATLRALDTTSGADPAPLVERPSEASRGVPPAAQPGPPEAERLDRFGAANQIVPIFGRPG